MSANSCISEVLEELATRCPVTNSILAALLETNIQSEKNTNDEAVISADCQSLKPLQKQDGRAFESFMNISDNPTSSFDQAKSDAWVERHKKNILIHYTTADDPDLEESSE